MGRRDDGGRGIDSEREEGWMTEGEGCGEGEEWGGERRKG